MNRKLAVLLSVFLAPATSGCDELCAPAVLCQDNSNTPGPPGPPVLINHTQPHVTFVDGGFLVVLMAEREINTVFIPGDPFEPLQGPTPLVLGGSQMSGILPTIASDGRDALISFFDDGAVTLVPVDGRGSPLSVAPGVLVDPDARFVHLAPVGVDGYALAWSRGDRDDPIALVRIAVDGTPLDMPADVATGALADFAADGERLAMVRQQPGPDGQSEYVIEILDGPSEIVGPADVVSNMVVVNGRFAALRVADEGSQLLLLDETGLERIDLSLPSELSSPVAVATDGQRLLVASVVVIEGDEVLHGGIVELSGVVHAPFVIAAGYFGAPSTAFGADRFLTVVEHGRVVEGWWLETSADAGGVPTIEEPMGRVVLAEDYEAGCNAGAGGARGGAIVLLSLILIRCRLRRGMTPG